MRNLITAQEVIDLAFAENSNMMAESISDTAIRIAEIKYIRPAFGAMYPLLADKYADFTNDYVKPALAYFVKCEIVSSIAIDMSNSGVAVANPQYQSAATDKQRQRLYDSEMSKAKTLLDFALSYIAENKESFPDFSGEAPKKHHRVGGILLGGGTSRSQSASIAGEAFKNEFERLSNKVEDLEEQSKGFMPATPSGDPMHYAYEAEGAVWNANTGYWEMYDMVDITTEQMRRAYNFGHFNTQDIAPFSIYNSSSPSNIRFNLPRTGAYAAYFSSFGSFASANFNIEVINLMSTPSMSYDKEQRSQIVNASYAFNYCEKLRRVLSFIDFTPATDVEGMFRRCFKLEQINCYGLKQNISFADSPLLSKDSLLYMIENCASDVSFTITLHPDVYDEAKYSWNTEIEEVIEDASSSKGTIITLASA